MKAIRIVLLTVSLGWFSILLVSWGVVLVAQMFSIPFIKDLTLWNIVGIAFIKILMDNKVDITMPNKSEGVSEETRATMVIVTSFIIKSLLIIAILLVAFLVQKIYLHG